MLITAKTPRRPEWEEKIQQALSLPTTEAADRLFDLLTKIEGERALWILGVIGVDIAALGAFFWAEAFLPPVFSALLAFLAATTVAAWLRESKRKPCERQVIAALTGTLTQIAAHPEARIAAALKSKIVFRLSASTLRGAKASLMTPMLQIMARCGEKSDLYRVHLLTQTTPFADAKRRAIQCEAVWCFNAIEARSDFGALGDVPKYLREGLASTSEDGSLDEGIVLRRQAMIRLLPQITPQNAMLLSRKEYGKLYTLLRFVGGYPVELLLAIVNLAGRLEDTQALPNIQRCAQLDGSDNDKRIIRGEAQRILPILEAKLEREKTGATLLRASAAPIGEGTLLRAAQGPTDNQPQTLLRAAAPDNDSGS